jgi:hypothetical protein
MAKGQHLTPHQQGIVKRYYEHRDTIALQKLGELVSELYLCTDRKKADRLWSQVRTALEKSGLDPARVESVLASRKVEELARLMNTAGR